MSLQSASTLLSSSGAWLPTCPTTYQLLRLGPAFLRARCQLYLALSPTEPPQPWMQCPGLLLRSQLLSATVLSWLTRTALAQSTWRRLHSEAWPSSPPYSRVTLTISLQTTLVGASTARLRRKLALGNRRHSGRARTTFESRVGTCRHLTFSCRVIL